MFEVRLKRNCPIDNSDKIRDYTSDDTKTDNEDLERERKMDEWITRGEMSENDDYDSTNKESDSPATLYGIDGTQMTIDADLLPSCDSSNGEYDSNADLDPVKQPSDLKLSGQQPSDHDNDTTNDETSGDDENESFDDETGHYPSMYVYCHPTETFHP